MESPKAKEGGTGRTPELSKKSQSRKKPADVPEPEADPVKKRKVEDIRAHDII